MSSEKRVVWSEGMLLQPQHFQQNTRYFEQLIRSYSSTYHPDSFGFSSIQIDKSYLKSGKLYVTQASGVLPDGTHFSFPSHDTPPQPIDISEEDLSTTIYLAVCVRKSNNTELTRNLNNLKSYRFAAEEIELVDTSESSSEKKPIEVSGLNFVLLKSTQNLDEFDRLSICKISDITQNGQVKLADNFIPPSINIKVNPVVSAFLVELLSLAEHRAASLAARVSVAGKASASEISDFLMLQSLNRYLPKFRHLSNTQHITPTSLYLELIEVIGDLATFIKPDKLAPTLPTFNQLNLTEVFKDVFDELRQLFNTVLEQNSIKIPLVEKKYGIRVGMISDKTLFKTGSFILAVTADISADDIRKYFPPQVKIGAVDQIKELVNVQLPGILLNNLAVAPREISYQRNYVYFELLPNGEYWNKLVQTGNIAIHIGSNFPGLSMELWAIRGNS